MALLTLAIVHFCSIPCMHACLLVACFFLFFCVCVNFYCRIGGFHRSTFSCSSCNVCTVENRFIWCDGMRKTCGRKANSDNKRRSRGRGKGKHRPGMGRWAGRDARTTHTHAHTHAHKHTHAHTHTHTHTRTHAHTHTHKHTHTHTYLHTYSQTPRP